MTENAGSGGNAQDKPQYLTKADVESMLGDFAKTIDTKIGGAVAGTLKKLDIGKAVGEAIAAHEAQKAERANGEGSEGSAGDKTQKVDPELVKTRRELDEFKRRFEAAEKARVETEVAARKKSALADLSSALNGKVRPEVASTLVGAWANEIAFDDEGNPLMPIGDGQSSTIAAAVEQRIKSKDYEWARPAPNNGGTGATGPRANGSSAPINLAQARAKAPKDRTAAEADAIYVENLKRNSENGV